jgi:chaperone required for assembly of F1-ATPase
MSAWKKRRFWSDVDILPTDNGFVVRLDGRVVKTPKRADLALPSRIAAELVAQEWAKQEGVIDPTGMPATRWANAAIDKIGAQKEAVVDMLAEYGASDLLCYRATHPEALIARQAAVWDAPLEWVKERFNAPLLVANGVIPVSQPNQSIANLKVAVSAFNAFELAAVHDLVQISGSLVLGLAVAHGWMDAITAWDSARVDENWQIEHWGIDEDAAFAALNKRESFLFAQNLINSARFER